MSSMGENKKDDSMEQDNNDGGGRVVMDSLVTATESPTISHSSTTGHGASQKKQSSSSPADSASSSSSSADDSNADDDAAQDNNDDEDEDSTEDDDDDDDMNTSGGAADDDDDDDDTSTASSSDGGGDGGGGGGGGDRKAKASPSADSTAAAKNSTSSSKKKTPAAKKTAASKKKKSATPSSAGSSKDGSASKPKSSSKSSSNHDRGPRTGSYLDMVHQAIASLNDRTGSSLPTIKKYVYANQKLPKGAEEWTAKQMQQFETRQNRLINQALKKGVSTNRFTKVRQSYKISPQFKAQKAQQARAKKQAAAAAKKRVAAAAAAAEKSKHDEAAKKKKKAAAETKLSPEEQARRAAALARKKERERLAKERHDYLKKRKAKFPIEDTRLHAEDLKYNVTGESDAGPRPTLPYFWHGLRHVVPDACDVNGSSSTTKSSSSATSNRRKTNSDLVLRNSRVDGLDVESRGLIPDLLQVYHFFRGDVHFGIASTGTSSGSSSSSGGGRGGKKQQQQQQQQEEAWAPEFGLHHLVHATAEILNGNAKRARCVPPLICHCFVTCLQILLNQHDNAKPETTSASASAAAAAASSSIPTVAEYEAKFHKDLQTYLAPALTAASWSDVCFLYMDAMERLYATDASRDATVLQPLEMDVPYILGCAEEPTIVAPMTPCVKASGKQLGAAPSSAPGITSGAEAEASSMPLPDGYESYLGDPRGALGRAYDKLGRLDPWLLSAEEIFALLRALTDDVLASNHPLIGQDMAAREEKMQELTKAKRAADYKFRKVRLAYEGPKRPNRGKSTTVATASAATTSSSEKKAPDDSSSSKRKNGNINTENENGKNGITTSNDKASDAVVPFKPTATKKQFEAALKAQQKANDAYENGIRTLVARTEPVGYDRNYNAVYCFRHDPEVLYVEDLRSPAAGNQAEHLPLDLQPQRRSWHVICNTSLFELFADSLDIRGKRENSLYEELMGPAGQPQQSLRRHLYDDKKVKAEAQAKVREMEALKKRLQSARIKCDEERGRRSGRLADQAEDELAQVQQEIDELQLQAKDKAAAPVGTVDYQDLTGLNLLRKFDTGGGRVGTRRSRQKQESKATMASTPRPSMPCSKLVPTGNIDGTGAVGLLVAKLLEIEEMCESLVPWERTDMERSTWISKLESAVHSWYTISPFQVGPIDPATADSNNWSRGSLGGSSVASSPASTAGSVSSKRRRTESPGFSYASPSSSGGTPSVASVVNSIRQPLLDLEARVADISNVSLAARDEDLADENMSTDGSDSEDDEAEKARLESEWKRIINRIRKIPAKKHVQIREHVVSAITKARQAHLPEIVASLRSALLLYHPNGAGECKAAAIGVLVSHGDYDGDDDEDDDDELGDDLNNNAVTKTNEEEDLPFLLCTEAAMLKSCLEGSDDATRLDWIETCKSCKAISRLASLTAAFCRDATEKMEQMQVEQDALMDAIDLWKKEARKSKKSDNGNANGSIGPSEVWANVRFTDEICMAKGEDWPWWPARVCEAKDPDLAASLSELNRTLIALIGEGGGLRVVRTTDQILPFTGEPIVTQDNDEVTSDNKSNEAAAAVEPEPLSKEVRGQLKDSLATARRVLRGQEAAAAGKKKKKK